MAPKQARSWWKEANGYQIYPASFQDSNDDGHGDIPGIISRLDYLQHLGVDLIWLSPVYDSPQHDMGYDISNYEDIWPKYGTLADMERLIQEVKARGMRIIMDLVVNHTSSEHKWFKESAKSKDEYSNPYHDWYLWRDPKGFDSDGKPIPPNNWRASFGGSVWSYVESRQQFYLHLFLPEQPDLNWFNPLVRRAVYASAIEFWLQKGVDGFRVDVVNAYCKDLSFPDSPVVDPNSPLQPVDPKYTLNGPLMHTWLQEQRREVLDKYGADIMLVGELHGTPLDEILRYLSPVHRELDTIFDFDTFTAGNSYANQMHDWVKATLKQLKPAFVKPQSFLSSGQAWPTTFLENHDIYRSIDRLGPGGTSQYFIQAAKLLALLTTTFSGTLFMYQGQEIGMTNAPSTWTRSDLRDPLSLNYLDTIATQYPHDAAMQKRALAAALRLGRDNARTPVQWTSDAPHAGFTGPHSQPWIGVNPNYASGINVAAQLGSNGTGTGTSILEFWRHMLRTRKEHKDILVYGDFELLTDPANADDDDTMRFLKTCPDTGRQILVELNFSDRDVSVPLELESNTTGTDGTSGSSRSQKSVLASTYEGAGADHSTPSAAEKKKNVLRPWEGRAYKLGSW